ncbi:hypothetical protein HBB16_21425 [Pseudonocardia sp. MCCB 268]|nr:hypothetical protein [Pseudonocardia cytotoxica]
MRAHVRRAIERWADDGPETQLRYPDHRRCGARDHRRRSDPAARRAGLAYGIPAYRRRGLATRAVRWQRAISGARRRRLISIDVDPTTPSIGVARRGSGSSGTCRTTRVTSTATS